MHVDDAADVASPGPRLLHGFAGEPSNGTVVTPLVSFIGNADFRKVSGVEMIISSSAATRVQFGSGLIVRCRTETNTPTTTRAPSDSVSLTRTSTGDFCVGRIQPDNMKYAGSGISTRGSPGNQTYSAALIVGAIPAGQTWRRTEGLLMTHCASTPRACRADGMRATGTIGAIVSVSAHAAYSVVWELQGGSEWDATFGNSRRQFELDITYSSASGVTPLRIRAFDANGKTAELVIRAVPRVDSAVRCAATGTPDEPCFDNPFKMSFPFSWFKSATLDSSCTLPYAPAVAARCMASPYLRFLNESATQTTMHGTPLTPVSPSVLDFRKIIALEVAFAGPESVGFGSAPHSECLDGIFTITPTETSTATRRRITRANRYVRRFADYRHSCDCCCPACDCSYAGRSGHHLEHANSRP